MLPELPWLANPDWSFVAEDLPVENAKLGSWVTEEVCSGHLHQHQCQELVDALLARMAFRAILVCVCVCVCVCVRVCVCVVSM